MAPCDHTATPMALDGGSSRPSTPMPVGHQGLPAGPSCGRTYITPRPHLLPQLNTMPDPYGVPPPPLIMPGVPPAAPQLMGSLPLSAPGDTSQFGAPFDAGLLNSDPPAAQPSVGSLAAAAAGGPATPTYSARVVAAVDRTQMGGPSTALLPPAIANDGPDPLGALLNNLPAPSAPAPPLPAPERPNTRAFVRPPTGSSSRGASSV